MPLDDNEIADLSDDALNVEINKTNTAINKITKSGPMDDTNIGSGLMDEDHEGYLIDFKEELDKLVAERSRRRAGGGESPSGKSSDWAEDNKDLIVGTPTSEDINLFSRTSQSASAGSNQDIQNAIDKVRERISSTRFGDDLDRIITMLNIYIKERAKRLSAGSWDVDFGGNKF